MKRSFGQDHRYAARHIHILHSGAHAFWVQCGVNSLAFFPRRDVILANIEFAIRLKIV